MSNSLKQFLIVAVKVIALTFVLMMVSGIGSRFLPAALLLALCVAAVWIHFRSRGALTIA